MCIDCYMNVYIIHCLKSTRGLAVVFRYNIYWVLSNSVLKWKYSQFKEGLSKLKILFVHFKRVARNTSKKLFKETSIHIFQGGGWGVYYNIHAVHHNYRYYYHRHHLSCSSNFHVLNLGSYSLLLRVCYVNTGLSILTTVASCVQSAISFFSLSCDNQGSNIWTMHPFN